MKIDHKINTTSISPEKAVDILKSHGTNVSTEDAELILDFMNKIVDLTIKNHQKNKHTKKTKSENRSNHLNDV